MSASNTKMRRLAQAAQQSLALAGGEEGEQPAVQVGKCDIRGGNRMKRVAMLAVAATLVMGLAVVGTPYAETDSEFTILGFTEVYFTGVLAFSGSELDNVQDPQYTGWAQTDEITVGWRSNEGAQRWYINIVQSFAHETSGVELITDLWTFGGIGGRWEGDSWGTALPNPAPFALPQPHGRSKLYVGWFTQDEFTQLKLRVWRDGLNTRPGRYVAVVSTLLTFTY